MNDWKTCLEDDPTEWLLEKENPSVRYFTLVDILEKPENHTEARKARNDIMRTVVVPEILSKQRNEGNWEAPESFYKSKYKSTVWQLIILAELGADGKNQQIQKACEFILENSQDRLSGGFSHVKSKTGGGTHGGVMPCLTGNMVWSLIRFGYVEDPRTQRGIDWIVKYQRCDDGIAEAPRGWPYRDRHCWGTHTCHMGLVKALKALAEVPVNTRSRDVSSIIERGVEHMLIHHVHKRSHDLSRVAKPAWLRFGFPLMWNTDTLEILGILTRLGYRDERMQEAVDLVVSKQDDQGKWKLESAPKKRFQVDIEQKGKPSKWITLNALRVIKTYYS